MGLYQINLPSPSLVIEQVIFKTIWDRLPKRSFVSGMWLRCYWNTALFNNCFTHILSVDKYPYFRMYFGAIILTTPGEHGLWIDGSEEDKIAYALDIEVKSKGRSTANWNAVKELETELKKLYVKSFPVTWGGIVNYNYTLEDQKRLVGALNKQFWYNFK